MLLVGVGGRSSSGSKRVEEREVCPSIYIHRHDKRRYGHCLYTFSREKWLRDPTDRRRFLPDMCVFVFDTLFAGSCNSKKGFFIIRLLVQA
jgi:hypothetical protein